VLKRCSDQATPWAKKESRGVCLEWVTLYDTLVVNEKSICVFQKVDEIWLVRCLLSMLAFLLDTMNSLVTDDSIPLLGKIVLSSQGRLSLYSCTDPSFLTSKDISLSQIA
jgi:hypothetical protein